MFSEKILEDMLFEALQDKKLDFLEERGLLCPMTYTNIERQLPLGKYGITDIVMMESIDEDIFLSSIIELKITPFCADSLAQLIRYMTGFAEYFRKSEQHTEKLVLQGVLICAKGIIKGSDMYLLNFIDPYIQVYTYSFDLEKGITFELISSRTDNDKWVKTDSKLNEFSDLERMIRLTRSEKNGLAASLSNTIS